VYLLHVLLPAPESSQTG